MKKFEGVHMHTVREYGISYGGHQLISYNGKPVGYTTYGPHSEETCYVTKEAGEDALASLPGTVKLITVEQLNTFFRSQSFVQALLYRIIGHSVDREGWQQRIRALEQTLE